MLTPMHETWGKNECVNPLAWKRDTTYAPARLNKGSVPKKYNRVDVGRVDAKISDQHLLWVHKPKKTRGYPTTKNYHVFDYSLFYMDIRENVKHRIDVYFGK